MITDGVWGVIAPLVYPVHPPSPLTLREGGNLDTRLRGYDGVTKKGQALGCACPSLFSGLLLERLALAAAFAAAGYY